MRGELAVLVSAILMGTLPYFIKSLNLHPLTMTFYRTGIAFLFTSLFMLVKREKPAFSLRLLILGLFNFGVVFFYITAISQLSAATAALLLYMAPVYVTAYTIFTGEFSKKSLFTLILGIFGLYLLLSPENEINTGIIAGMLSGISYAVLFILLNRFGKLYSSLQITFSNLLIPTLLAIPFVRITPADPSLVIGLGLISTAIPFLLLTYGMSRTRVDKGPLIALIEPVVAGFIGFMIFGEMLEGVQLIGAVLIMIAVIIALNEDGEKHIGKDQHDQ
ncbi:EamA family transporter [Geoglobus acetivorans]|uniref:DMT family transporter n=1 Tax=Geoglobus acetivorans TaxID=565033 RepID=A0ABZ3H3T1_GEOAI|nr:EamA family transporter [Geoglobus acetivorans]